MEDQIINGIAHGNLTRHIADVHSTQLRAVTPIHIQYLKNMKVDSIFSISIICHEELWGHGQGIDNGQKLKIFDLFHRANNVGIIEGSGVGLAIVRKIMHRHGGKIQVTSTSVAGATFLLYFKRNDIGQHV